MIEITATSISALESESGFRELVSEYAAECALANMPAPDEKLSAYRAIDGSAFFAAFAAHSDGVLVGFVFVLTPIIPHYGYSIAVTESLFVGGQYRKTGAGIALIRHAEKYAASFGSPAISVSAPSGGRLQSILPRIGYRETNRIYLKVVNHG